MLLPASGTANVIWPRGLLGLVSQRGAAAASQFADPSVMARVQLAGERTSNASSMNEQPSASYVSRYLINMGSDALQSRKLQIKDRREDD